MQTSNSIPKNLSDLGFSEQLTLWSIRYWADACRNDHSPYGILKDAYKLAKSSESLLALDSFLTLMISGNSRPVDIRCLCCEGISRDEWRILQSIALMQQGEKHMAPRLLSHFLGPSATRMASSLIRDWAHSLTAGDHQLPIRRNVLSAVQKFHPAPAENVGQNPQPTLQEQQSVH